MSPLLIFSLAAFFTGVAARQALLLPVKFLYDDFQLSVEESLSVLIAQQRMHRCNSPLG